MMHFDDQSGVLVLIRLLLCWGESGHPHWFGVLPGLSLPGMLLKTCTIYFSSRHVNDTDHFMLAPFPPITQERQTILQRNWQ